MPIVFILCLIIFGSLVAALMPTLVGAIAVFGAFAVVRLITDVHRRLGLRDQRHHADRHGPGDRLRAVRRQPVPRGARQAARRRRASTSSRDLQATMATAGRTVLFSGLTVAASLASLLIFPQNFLRSMGLGGMAAVLVAMTAALTVLPAVLIAARPPDRRRPDAVATLARHRPPTRTRTARGPGSLTA